MTENVIKNQTFCQRNIPVGLLLFTLLHEPVFTGAVSLAAPLISSVVITETENIVKFKPVHRCRLLRALHAAPRAGGHASLSCHIIPVFSALHQSCTSTSLTFP